MTNSQIFNNGAMIVIGLFLLLCLFGVVAEIVDSFRGKTKYSPITKQKKKRKDYTFLIMGQYAEEDDKQHGGGAWR